MKSDAELVSDILAGERRSFAKLFERHERSVLAVAWAVVRDYHLAQDVVQDAFGAAYEKLPQLRSPQAFGAWVRTIARRRALDLAQRPSPALDPDVHGVTEPGSPSEPDESQRALLQAVSRLPQHEQVVLTLRYFEGHSVQGISEMTGRPVGTVTMQLSRARNRLRRWLKETDHEENA